MINWKVRIKNKMFWVALIPAALVLAQTIAGMFGFSLDLSEMESRLLDFMNALFVVLSILGIVNDPTTDGLPDSEQAMTYDEPKKE